MRVYLFTLSNLATASKVGCRYRAICSSQSLIYSSSYQQPLIVVTS